MPTNNTTLELSISDAKNKLINITNDLDKFTFPEPNTITTFKTNELTEEKIKEIADTLPSDLSEIEIDYIYTIKVRGESSNISIHKKRFKVEKTKTQKNKDMCRINAHNSKQYLYVGRSQNIRTRIRQHLSGIKYKGTYALHMLRWCAEIESNIEITCYELKDMDNLMVQTIEDALWEKLLPCFGRKGDK